MRLAIFVGLSLVAEAIRPDVFEGAKSVLGYLFFFFVGQDILALIIGRK